MNFSYPVGGYNLHGVIKLDIKIRSASIPLKSNETCDWIRIQ